VWALQDDGSHYPGKLDTDEARDSAMEFGISAIPTIILFKGGQVQKKWVGLASKKDLTAAIEELL
jgi:thioredoxin 1